ncbi:hypothetical protein QBC39DRAFT_22675 [Podospora conica]|nr:hypothetical protein QBC39DRAFT_22675 [Schizothecium conicum]
MADSDNVEAFTGITGANETAAQHMLELCGGDLEQAVQLWFTDEDLQRTLSNPAGATPAAAAGLSSSRHAQSSSRPTRRPAGREDAAGVITIDSDDSDDDVDMTEDDAFDDDDDQAVAQTVARTAQEEEDAAMAKRLQEELYGGGGGGGAGMMADDDVRAPMARTTETLVAPEGFPGHGSADAVLEGMRQRAMARQQAARARANPFAQSVWDESGRATAGPSAPAAAPSSAAPTSSRATRLAELFRPPYDIMSMLPWDEAREVGKEEKKWLLVNLQNMEDFQCQALNRDHWKDEAIKALIKENFLFLQYDKSEHLAERYIGFYFPNQSHENINNYPHVSVIDPRTGEQVKVWSGSPFPSALDFYGQLVEFLDRYSLAANSKNPVTKAKRPERSVNVDRMTEDEMLQLAMQNSLEAANGSLAPDVVDPDELTKSTGDVSQGKGKGKAGEEEAVAAAEPSAFARIPSDRPHVEPAADPKTTTRIQIRNPPSRIIRRFGLDERVARLYEWLKAEPLPGKEGVEFELKSMPQGVNLLECLDATIAEAGLANGTVMVEFVEE